MEDIEHLKQILEKPLKLYKIIIIAVGAAILNILGYAIPILVVANFLWLLINDTLLFPWIWVLYTGIAFLFLLVAYILTFIGLTK